jgi:hypothetical protein
MSYGKPDTNVSMTGSPLDPKRTTSGGIMSAAEHILSGKPFKASRRDMYMISIGLTLRELSPSFSLSLPESLGILNSDGRLDVVNVDTYYSTLLATLTDSM